MPTSWPSAYAVHVILQVWFLGKADVSKVRGNPHLYKNNCGYDDERGDYLVTMRDHIAYRYEVQSVLGKGSFGQVLRVLDYKTGAVKALKIIRNKKRFHQQAREHIRHVCCQPVSQPTLCVSVCVFVCDNSSLLCLMLMHAYACTLTGSGRAEGSGAPAHP